MIDERGGEIMPLPEGSFKESGTGVNTVIVKIPVFLPGIVAPKLPQLVDRIEN